MIDFFARFIQVTRQTRDGQYVNGVFQPGHTQTFVVRATVQPLSAQELLLLPEGERTKEAIRLWTQDELFTVDAPRARKADILCIDGRTYEVQQVKHWTTVLMPHFDVIAVDRNTRSGP